MAKPDKQVMAIFDGLAYLAEAVYELSDMVAHLRGAPSGTDARTAANRAKAIFRKAASEASGVLDTQKNAPKKKKKEADSEV